MAPVFLSPGRESGEQVAPSIDSSSLYSASERKPPSRSLPGQSSASDTLCAPADGAAVSPTVPSEEKNRQVHLLFSDGPADVSQDNPGHGLTDPIRPALCNPAGTTQESSAVSSNSKTEELHLYSSSSMYTSHSMDTKPGIARVSVSLPRSYRRSDSSRLTSVVTPRPFGTQSTKVSSLPRTFIVSHSTFLTVCSFLFSFPPWSGKQSLRGKGRGRCCVRCSPGEALCYLLLPDLFTVLLNNEKTLSLISSTCFAMKNISNYLKQM